MPLPDEAGPAAAPAPIRVTGLHVLARWLAPRGRLPASAPGLAAAAPALSRGLGEHGLWWSGHEQRAVMPSRPVAARSCAGTPRICRSDPAGRARRGHALGLERASGSGAAGGGRHAADPHRQYPGPSRCGIAVLEVVPGPTVSDAAARLRRLLETAGFAATFGGLPPVIHLSMPLRMLPDLGASLDQALGRLPLLAMRRRRRLGRRAAAPASGDGTHLAEGPGGGQPEPGTPLACAPWPGSGRGGGGHRWRCRPRCPCSGPPAGPAAAERRDLATAEAAPALPVQTWQPPPLLLPPMMPGPPESLAALPVSTPEIASP